MYVCYDYIWIYIYNIIACLCWHVYIYIYIYKYEWIGILCIRSIWYVLIFIYLYVWHVATCYNMLCVLEIDDDIYSITFCYFPPSLLCCSILFDYFLCFSNIIYDVLFCSVMFCSVMFCSVLFCFIIFKQLRACRQAKS